MIRRNDNYLKEMGVKIKAQRMAQNISGKQLGRMCGLDHNSFWRIEAGQKNSHILTLKTIADKLGIELNELL